VGKRGVEVQMRLDGTPPPREPVVISSVDAEKLAG